MLGHDPARRQRAFLERIGIVLQEEGLDPNLNVGEAVALYSAAYPNPRPVDEVLELVGLAGRAGDRAATMSGGQRRRLDLALGIAGDPEILFLDEPTTGFDPSARRHAWDVIKRPARARQDDPPHHALHGGGAGAGRPRRRARRRPRDRRRHAGLARRRRRVDRLLPRRRAPRPLRDDHADRATSPRPAAAAADRGEELEGLTVTRPSLEDVYLELTEDR